MVKLGLPGLLQSAIGVRGRMAGARRGPARARPGYFARISGRGASRIAARFVGRRALLAFLGAAAAFFFVASAQAQVLSSRIWPARDYTRLTVESKAELKYTLFAVKDPERLVLDLEVDELPPALAELNGKVAGDDPYVQGLRVARNRPGVVRLVLDLKSEVKPQVFTLPPIGEYGHRLVLDIYPVVAIDPLAELILESEKKLAASAKPESAPAEKARVARMATIVIDAGHGGEDPGAIGRRGSREKNITLSIAKRLK